MAASVTDANQLIKSGTVQIGSCIRTCTFFDTGKCTCGGWQKITVPFQEIETGLKIKIKDGNWRKIGRASCRERV